MLSPPEWIQRPSLTDSNFVRGEFVLFFIDWQHILKGGGTFLHLMGAVTSVCGELGQLQCICYLVLCTDLSSRGYFGIQHCSYHDDVIKWKHFPHYWPFVRGIHRPVMWSFNVFFDLCLYKRLSKQLWGWWCETLSCPLCRNPPTWKTRTCSSCIDNTMVADDLTLQGSRT